MKTRCSTRFEFEEALFKKLSTHDHVDALLFLTILVLFSCIPLKTKLIVLLKACAFSDDDHKISVVHVELLATSIYRVVSKHARCTNLRRGGHVFTHNEIKRTMRAFCCDDTAVSRETFASECSSSEEIQSWNAALSRSLIGRNEFELYPLRRLKHVRYLSLPYTYLSLKKKKLTSI